MSNANEHKIFSEIRFFSCVKRLVSIDKGVRIMEFCWRNV